MFRNIYIESGIKISQFLVGLLFFFMNNSLCFSNEKINTSDTLTITFQNNGDTIQVSPATTLMLKLESIPGTGYAWYADPVKYLVLIELPVSVPGENDTPDTAIGAPVCQIFRYLAEKEGTEVLKLFYMRLWEKNKPPLNSFTITVDIQ
jgi:inhibitor of cysteine peptidase